MQVILVVPLLIYGSFILLGLASIVLAIAHRSGRLRRVRHVHLFGGIALMALMPLCFILLSSAQ